MVDSREIEELRALAFASIPAKKTQQAQPQQQHQAAGSSVHSGAGKRKRTADDTEEGEILSDEDPSVSLKACAAPAAHGPEAVIINATTTYASKLESCLQVAAQAPASVNIPGAISGTPVMLRRQASSELNTFKVSQAASSKGEGEFRLKTSSGVKVGEGKAVPQPSSTVQSSQASKTGPTSIPSTAPFPIGNARKEADVFLASLNIPVTSNLPHAPNFGGDRNGSFVIKFSDDDSDSDVDMQGQAGRNASEKQKWVANGLQSSNGVQSSMPGQTTEGFKSQIDRIKKQIAAMQSMKSKVGVSKSSRAPAISGLQHVNVKHGQSAPAELENLRKQIAAKESELQLLKQRGPRESTTSDALPNSTMLGIEGGSKTQGLLNLSIESGDMHGLSLKQVEIAKLEESQQKRSPAGIHIEGNGTSTGSIGQYVQSSQAVQSLENSIVPDAGLFDGADKKHSTSNKASATPKRKRDESDRANKSSVLASAKERVKKQKTKHPLLNHASSGDEVRSVDLFRDGGDDAVFASGNNLVTDTYSKSDALKEDIKTTAAVFSTFKGNDDSQRIDTFCAVGDKRSSSDQPGDISKHECEMPVSDSAAPQFVANVGGEGTRTVSVTELVSYEGKDTFHNIASSPVSSSWKAIVEKHSDSGSRRDTQVALVGAKPNVSSWVLESQLQSSMAKFHGLSEKRLEFGGPDALRQLQEEEDLVDKELEEAQQNRRKCEVRERFARKHYRDAQDSLHSATLQCEMLYQKREMLAMRIKTAQIQYLPSMPSLSHMQNSQGKLLFPGSACYPGRSSMDIASSEVAVNQLEGTVILPSAHVSVDLSEREREPGKGNLRCQILKGTEFECAEPSKEPPSRLDSSLSDGVHCYGIEKEFHHGFSSASFATDLQRNCVPSLQDSKELSDSDTNKAILEAETIVERLQHCNQGDMITPLKSSSVDKIHAGGGSVHGEAEYLDASSVPGEGVLARVRSTAVTVVSSDRGEDLMLSNSNIHKAGGLQPDCHNGKQIISELESTTDSAPPQSVEDSGLLLSTNLDMNRKSTVTLTSSAAMMPSSRLKPVFGYDLELTAFEPEEIATSAPLIDENSLITSVKYDSPLQVFRSYRFNGQFLKVSNPLSCPSTQIHGVDPFKILCKFEHRGKCNNNECTWQHKRDYDLVPGQSQRYADTNKASDSTEGTDATRLDLSGLTGTSGNVAICSPSRKSGSPAGNYHIMKVPTYYVGSHIVKMEQCSYPLFASNCMSESGFWQPLSVALPVHRVVPVEMVCLLDSSRPQTHVSGSGQFSFADHRQQVEDEGHYSASAEDVESLLEAALNFINFDCNSVKVEARKKALYLLSRCLEAKPSSVALWVVYLHLFYRREKSLGDDDMFYHAVRHNKGSYELWILFINSRKHLSERLEAYESAISALGSTAEYQGSQQTEQSPFLLDLVLQMLNCMCYSASSQEAISWISELRLLAFESVHDLKKPATSSRLALLTCLTKHDLCILWICCAYMTLQLRLPTVVVESLGCKQQLPLLDIWQDIEASESRGAHAMKVMHVAASDSRGCLKLLSCEVPLEKDAQLSKEAMVVNYVQCAALCEGPESALTLANKFFNLYSSSVQLILLQARLERHINGKAAGSDIFEQAILGWPLKEAGKVRLWHQYIGYSWEVKGIDHMKMVLARSAAEIHSISERKTSTCEAFCSLFGPTQSMPRASFCSFSCLNSGGGENKSFPLSEEERDDCIRQAFRLIPSLLKQQQVKGAGSFKQALSSRDAVFGFLNLALFEALSGDIKAAVSAVYSGLNIAVDIDDVRHCLREIATLTYSGVKVSSIPLLLHKNFLTLLDRCFIESQLLTSVRPLSKGFLESIKNRRVRGFMEYLLGQLPVDYSLLNDVLESVFGPMLLPSESIPMKKLIDFMEKMMEVIPNNFKLASSICRVVQRRADELDNVANSMVLFWSVSLLIDSLCQSAPPAPECEWVEAGKLLGLLRIDALSEDYYQRALSVYPFSTALWHELLDVCSRTGEPSWVMESALKRGARVSLHD